jgi:hypothetical protein
MEVKGQLHAPATLSTGEEAPGTHWKGGWVDLRADLDAVPLLRIDPRLLSRPSSNPVVILTELVCCVLKLDEGTKPVASYFV